MVPGVGYHHLRVELSAPPRRVLVKQLLDGYRQQGRPECYPARHLEFFPTPPGDELYDARNNNARGCCQQCQSDEKRSDGFKLAVSVVVRLVLRLGADAHEHQHQHVGHEVRQRVHGIGYHRRAVAQHAGNELKREQHRIACAAQERHLIDFFFASHDISYKLSNKREEKTFISVIIDHTGYLNALTRRWMFSRSWSR